MTRRPRSSKKPTEKKPLASRAQEGTGGTLILPHLVRYSDIAALVDYLTKKTSRRDAARDQKCAGIRVA